MSERCSAVRNDGQRCEVDFGLNPANGRCWHHDPERAKSRKRARAQGGRTTSSMQRARWSRTVSPDEVMEDPQTVADAVRWASWLPRAIATGEIDKATGREINSSLKTFVALYEKSELEGEVAELRRKLEALNAGAA